MIHFPRQAIEVPHHSLRWSRSTAFSMPQRPHGFTMIEVLVTLTIGSLLVISAVSATRALMSTREKIGYRIERLAEGRRALEAITAALRNVRRDPISGKPVIVGQSGGSGARNDRIDLLVIDDRRVRTEGAESDQYEIGFYLASEGDGQPPALYCRRDHAFDDHPREGGVATVVAEGVLGLSFEYYMEGEWYSEWPPTEPRIPQAVRVTLVTTSLTEGRSGRSMQPEPLVLSAVVAVQTREPEKAPEKQSGRNQENQPEQNQAEEGGRNR